MIHKGKCKYFQSIFVRWYEELCWNGFHVCRWKTLEKMVIAKYMKCESKYLIKQDKWWLLSCFHFPFKHYHLQFGHQPMEMNEIFHYWLANSRLWLLEYVNFQCVWGAVIIFDLFAFDTICLLVKVKRLNLCNRSSIKQFAFSSIKL